MLQVEAVTKKFDDLVALDKVDLFLKQGRSLALIGPAAAGKSVLLKCLVGLYAPSEGVIRIDGQEVGTAAQRPKALSHRIGMLFQQNALFDSLTVWENIAFRLMADGMGRRAARAQAEALLPKVGLPEENAILTPADLSGGMQKRVAIARAIVMNPKYLFCDEPNSGLDPKTAIIIDNLIQEITEEFQITTVINTHDMNSVMEIGQKIIFLENGTKAWEGDKEEIFVTDNKAVGNFVYSSELFKKVRATYQKK